MIGRRVEVVADLNRVQVFCDGRLVADHARVWARHQTITDPVHVAAAKALRRDRVGLLRPAPEPEVEQRRLTDYDDALGITTTTTPMSTATGRWPDDHDTATTKTATRDLTAEMRVPDPGVEGTHVAGVGGPARRTSPGRDLDP